MDKFTFIIGITGIVLLVIALFILIHSIVKAGKRRMRIKGFLFYFLVFLIIFAFSISFIYLSLFLKTFSRYTYEERLGKIYAEKQDGVINVFFSDEKNDNEYQFTLSGNQWMIEGCILRWNQYVRWLGADSYYKVTRFRGRWEESKKVITEEYEIQPQGRVWRFLLLHGESMPLVDTAYGIAAFQYPSKDTFSIYINETGFILRKN